MILYTLVVLPLSGPQSYANVLIQSQIFCSSLCVAGVFRAGQLNWCRDENERNLSLSLCSFGCSAGFPHQDAQAPAEWAPTASLVSLCFLCEMDDMKPKVKEGTRRVRTGHAFPWLTGFRTHTHIYILCTWAHRSTTLHLHPLGTASHWTGPTQSSWLASETTRRVSVQGFRWVRFRDDGGSKYAAALCQETL